MSELYHPDAFRRVEIEGRSWGAKRSADLQIWLVNEFGLVMAGAEYELEIGAEKRTGSASPDGFLIEENLPTASKCSLRWHKVEDSFAFSRIVTLKKSSNQEKRARAQLENLGYEDGDDDTCLEAFALDEELGDAGKSERFSRLDQIHAGAHPPGGQGEGSSLE